MLTHKVNTGFLFAAVICLTIYSFYGLLPWWVYIAPFVLWFIIAGWGSAFVQSGYHIKTFNSAKTADRKVAITFDDGPTPYTEEVLRLLRQYNIKATFFCIGRQIEKHPDIFQQVINEGHTVGNHTYTHWSRISLLSEEKFEEEVVLTDKAIEKYGEKKALFFRPPYGVTNPNIAKALKATGHKVIGWNIRSLDGRLKNEQLIFNRIKTRLAPGSIILLHDTSQKSVNVLEQLLILLQQQKYDAVTVDELLNIPAYEK
ncbi:MAG: polysaccharide deacetylase family protein [Flavobacterium psychrophilum]|nr:MAG: polysaccharide deacetylase family protein [Flavobacterium psychrophilum]